MGSTALEHRSCHFARQYKVKRIHKNVSVNKASNVFKDESKNK